MFYKAVTFLVFSLLVFKGFNYINFEQQEYTQMYTQSWNLQMDRLNNVQTSLLGEKKFDFSKFVLTSQSALRSFMINLGLFYIIAGFSIQYRAHFIRFISGIVLLLIFITYGSNKKQFEQIDYMEKYYHFALSLVFFLHHLIEPRLYSEKNLFQLLENQKEQILKQIESSKVKKVKKNKNKQGEQEVKEESNNHHQHHVHHQEENLEENLEEQEEEESTKINNSKNTNSNQNKESDSEDEQEKRKYQVDDDGFSIVPKKNIKKVQETRKVTKSKKKEHFDI